MGESEKRFADWQLDRGWSGALSRGYWQKICSAFLICRAKDSCSIYLLHLLVVENDLMSFTDHSRVDSALEDVSP